MNEGNNQKENELGKMLMLMIKKVLLQITHAILNRMRYENKMEMSFVSIEIGKRKRRKGWLWMIKDGVNMVTYFS